MKRDASLFLPKRLASFWVYKYAIPFVMHSDIHERRLLKTVKHIVFLELRESQR